MPDRSLNMREIQQGSSQNTVSEATFITLVVDDRFRSFVEQRNEFDEQFKELADIRSKFRHAVPGLRAPSDAASPLQAHEVENVLREIAQLRVELRGVRHSPLRARSRHRHRRAIRHQFARRVVVVCGAAIVPLVGLATLLVNR
jgi:hypothetical protein